MVSKNKEGLGIMKRVGRKKESLSDPLFFIGRKEKKICWLDKSKLCINLSLLGE